MISSLDPMPSSRDRDRNKEPFTPYIAATAKFANGTHFTLRVVNNKGGVSVTTNRNEAPVFARNLPAAWRHVKYAAKMDPFTQSTNSSELKGDFYDNLGRNNRKGCARRK